MYYRIHILLFIMYLGLCGCRYNPREGVAEKKHPETDSCFRWKMYRNPEDAGFSKQKLDSICQYYQKSQLSSLLIVYKGSVILSLGDYQRRFPCHSIRKSLMNAVFGLGYDEGKIKLGKTLKDLNIDDLDKLTETEKMATIEQLLQSRSGVYHPAVYETPSMERSKPERGSFKNGAHWYYNNWDFNVLSTVVEQEMGDDFLHVFAERIARPLGMEDFREFDGHYFADSTVSFHKAYAYKLSARDLARFGLLYLQNGLWDGKRILSEEWIKMSTISYSESHTVRGGYGYLWWIPTLADTVKTFAACGVGTQVLLVIPGLDMVVIQRINTFIGNNHPFDQKLYKMIMKAKISPCNDSPELIPLPATEKEKHYGIQARENYVGRYRSQDGIYSVMEYEEGLLIEYPKGMKALLIPQQEEDTFIVEDILEIIKLEKSHSSETGRLTVRGYEKQRKS